MSDSVPFRGSPSGVCLFVCLMRTGTEDIGARCRGTMTVCLAVKDNCDLQLELYEDVYCTRGSCVGHVDI